MLESTAQANGQRPGATERLTDYAAPVPPRAGRHRKPWLPWLTMARYRVIVISISGSSTIFVLGIVMGLQVAR